MIGFEFIPDDGDLSAPFEWSSTQPPVISDNDLSIIFARWLWKDTTIGNLLGLNDKTPQNRPRVEQSPVEEVPSNKTANRRIGHYFKSQF